MNVYPTVLEPYIDGDIIVGEPFTDVNGNGEYDDGIDGFIMSVGDDNQDLNHDGRCNSWNNTEPYQWNPLIPWEDLNADGEFTLPNSQADSGEWFGDANGNGLLDHESGMQLTCCRASVEQSGTTYYWYYRDSIFEHTTDSGFYYCLPERSDLTWDYLTDSPRKVSHFSFTLNDSGLLYNFSDQSIFLLDTGEIKQSTKLFSMVEYGWPDTLWQTVSIGDTTTLNGVFYVNLLSIRFTWDHPDSIAAGTSNPSRFYFLFDLYLGLIDFVAPMEGINVPEHRQFDLRLWNTRHSMTR